MISRRFHSLEGLHKDDVLAGNVRVFKGDDGPYLKVPGLMRLEGVRVGEMEIPLEIVQEFPRGTDMTRFDEVPTKLVDFVETAEGEQVLLRSIQSNHGIWQSGVPIYVSGEWDLSVAPMGAEPGQKALGDMTFDELKAVAKTKGQKVLPGTSRDGLLAALMMDD